MKKLFSATILLLSLASSVKSQNGATANLTGTVMDSSSGKPLSFVTVILQNAATHTPVKSVVTGENGSFRLTTTLNPAAGYNLFINYVGYHTKNISLAKTVQDLGAIALSSATGQLNTVTVTSSRPLIKQEIDRLTYDVQSDPQAKGQTAMDMLRRVPLITVDGDDNIELQGSGNYRIFINGKPSALVTNNPKDVLRAMPANQIQKIEVITTPPAKYDAEGLAGIINIITIKKTTDGYNGTVTLRESLPFGPGIGFSGTAKQNKLGFSVFGGGNNQSNITIDQYNERRSYGAVPYVLSQQALNSSNGNSGYIGTETSYEFDTLHLLTASANYGTGHNKQDYDRTSSYYIANSGSVLQSYQLFNDGGYNFTNLDLGINYQLGFKHKKDELLTTSYRYSYSLNGQFSDLVAADRFKYDQPDNNQRNDAGYKEHTFQLDYVYPSKKINIEAGAKTILRDNYSNASGQIFVPSTGYINDPALANDFNYRQNIYSLYNSYVLRLEKWTIQAGVRAELTQVNADFTSTATKFNMHYVNVIPSLSILKPLKNNATLSFGITNRLMRPGIQQLNPFEDKSNPQLISTGNPNLNPVISHSFEIGYNKVGKGSLNIRVGYTYVNNRIESVIRVVADTLSITSYDNVGQNKNARLNINGNYPLSKKLSINFNSLLFYVWIKGTYNGQFFSNEGPRTNTFANMSYKINSTWQVGASGGYNRRYINLQGSSDDYYYSTFSTSCTLKKFTFNVNLNNPFTTHFSFKSYTDTPDFYQSNTYNSVYRNLSISASYKFGKLNSSIKKNKRGINNDDTTAGSN